MFESEAFMYQTVAVALFVLWCLCLATSYMFHGFVHLLFVGGVVLLFVHTIKQRRRFEYIGKPPR